METAIFQHFLYTNHFRLEVYGPNSKVIRMNPNHPQKIDFGSKTKSLSYKCEGMKQKGTATMSRALSIWYINFRVRWKGNCPHPCDKGETKYGYSETGSITFEQLESGAHSGGKCKGPTANFSCCREDNKCGEDEGDCDDDKDCLEGLKCGKNNCKISAGFRPDYDCCVKP